MPVSDRSVWFVCKDPGGTNGILPVYDYLTQQGWLTELIANGKAVELLQAMGRQFKTVPSAADAIVQLEEPAAVVTSMCFGGGLGRDLIPLFHEKNSRVPIIALQDFWGSGLWADWADLKYRPNYIVVNDPVGAEIVQQAWPEFAADRIKIFGYPALDKYAGVDTAATRQQVKEKLGILDNYPIILYASQLTGAATTFRELKLALRVVADRGEQPINLIPRLHPRMKNNAPQEYRYLNQAMYCCGPRIMCWPFTDICDTSELIQAADVVIAEWSTALIETAAVRRVPIAVLYPNEGMSRFRVATGGQINEFPLISLGCAAKAESRLDLTLWPDSRNID